MILYGRESANQSSLWYIRCIRLSKHVLEACTTTSMDQASTPTFKNVPQQFTGWLLCRSEEITAT
jgi:hypothetical protein